MKEKIRMYYESGVWSEERVRKAVELGVLRAEEYEEVTGLRY